MRRALWLAALLAAPPALAEARGFGPFATPGNPVTREVARPPAAPREGDSALFLRLAYDFYRTVLSPVDGPRCQHRPTCARYGLLAVERHGALGLLLTIDRLWRGPESSALRLMRLSISEDRLLFLDPLEESTFWFTSSP